MSRHLLQLNNPEYLYKYLGEDRIDFLDECNIRFSPRNTFNDPFEQLKSDRTSLESLRPCERNALFANCANTHEHSPKLVADLLKKKFDFEKKTESPKDRPDYTNGGGLLCLSETPDNLLMWSHYASEHRGIVIEFKANYFFEHQLYLNKGEFIVRKVKYRDARVDDQPNGIFDSSFQIPHDTITTKSTHWDYEHEWRIEGSFSSDIFFKVTDKETQQIVLDLKKNEIFLHKIPEKYIRKVIFGASCSLGNILKIKNSIINNSKLNHIHMKMAVLDPVDFKIRLINIKAEDFSNIDEREYAA